MMKQLADVLSVRYLLRGSAFLTLVLLVAAVAFTAVPAHGQLAGLNTTTGVLRAKAAPDDCWAGLGMNTAFTVPPCAAGVPKVNSGYVWAMAEAGENIYFGTLANGECITEGGLLTTPAPPYVTDSWACEFADSPYVGLGIGLPGNLGDFRPPQIFVYNKLTEATTELTPPHVMPSAKNPGGFDPLIETTLGIRAAVNTGSLMLMVGQNLAGSINLFAYDPNNPSPTNVLGEGYLGEYTLPCTNVPNLKAGTLLNTCYGQIRQFLNYQGVIYTAVAKVATTLNLVSKAVTNVATTGAILKYTGSAPPAAGLCSAACFTFTEVGTIPDGQGAYIAAHDGRIYVTTWPVGGRGSLASLYMSPVVPDGGLTGDPVWTKVWSAANYDPDPINQAAYNGGALADFDGYLYWGTMHPPLLASAIFANIFGVPASQDALLTMLQDTFQTAALFRGTNFDTTPQIDLLYGSPVLPQYNPATMSWNLVPNNMPPGHQNPIYGEPGLGAPYNNYIWSMTVWNNQLWVGTMDWSYMALHGYAAIVNAMNNPGGPPLPPLTSPTGIIPFAPVNLYSFINFIPGADLYFFQDSSTPAIPEDVSGVGNPTSYGVRNMVPSSTTDDSLFLGMANPMNLLTSASLSPYQGGWEFIQLSANPGSTPVNTVNGFACVPNTLTGAGTVQCTANIVSPATGLGALVAIAPFLYMIPGSPSLTLPATAYVQSGQTSGTFSVDIPEVPAATESAIEAAFNGGTMVATVQLSPGTPVVAASLGTLSLTSPLPSRVIGVSLNLTNKGTGVANSVALNSLVTKTLSGSGSVTYLGLSPGGPATLPASLGTIPVGSTDSVVLYFSVPSTVTRFSISETGSVASLGGTVYQWSAGQALFSSQAH